MDDRGGRAGPGRHGQWLFASPAFPGLRPPRPCAPLLWKRFRAPSLAALKASAEI